MTLITNLDTARGGGIYSASSLASFNRPADTTAYSTGDAFSDSTGTPAAIVFPGCGPSGIIHNVSLVYSQAVASSFMLLLFDSEPANLADNAALQLDADDADNLIGVYEFLDGGRSQVSGTPAIVHYSRNAIEDAVGQKPYTSDGAKLYGLLKVTTAFTPASAAKMRIRLQLEIDHK